MLNWDFPHSKGIASVASSSTETASCPFELSDSCTAQVLLCGDPVWRDRCCRGGTGSGVLKYKLSSVFRCTKDLSDSTGTDGIWYATLPCLVACRYCFADILHFLGRPMLMFWGRQCLGSVHCLLWSNRFLQYYSHTQTHTHTHTYIHIYIYISVVIQAVIRFPLYKRFDISRKVRLDNFNFILQTCRIPTEMVFALQRCKRFVGFQRN